MVVGVFQSVQDGLGPERAALVDVLPTRRVCVLGKENELRLRLGSGFRCGVMENGGRFHGCAAHPRHSHLDLPRHPS